MSALICSVVGHGFHKSTVMTVSEMEWECIFACLCICRDLLKMILKRPDSEITIVLHQFDIFSAEVKAS